MRYQNAFNLERSYTVTARLDNIIISSDIPEVAVLILPSSIACMIQPVVPCLSGKLIITVITVKKAVLATLGTDYYLTDFSDRHRISVIIDNVDIIERSRLAH